MCMFGMNAESIQLVQDPLSKNVTKFHPLRFATVCNLFARTKSNLGTVTFRLVCPPGGTLAGHGVGNVLCHLLPVAPLFNFLLQAC